MTRRSQRQTQNVSPDPDRRGLLKAALAAGALGAAGGVGLSGISSVSYAEALTKEQRDALSPDDVVAMLKKGNERFRNGEMAQHDYLAQKRASSSGQYPVAAILSCIDSRTPAEILLDMGIGDAFNARVAGNICNEHILGSLEFACAVAGAKVILVMGHTGCGAVKGAIDDVQLGNLTGLLGEIKPAVRATEYSGERNSKNAEYVDLVAANNVRRSIGEIRDKSTVLAKLEQDGKIKIVGAMYRLTDGQLNLLD